MVLGRLVAPVIEELLKGALIIVLIRGGRVGFLVDATIQGFAIGAGFALVENLYYLGALPDSSLGLWLIRGFGTAIMHGGTTAIFAIFSKGLTQSLSKPPRREHRTDRDVESHADPPRERTGSVAARDSRGGLRPLRLLR